MTLNTSDSICFYHTVPASNVDPESTLEAGTLWIQDLRSNGFLSATDKVKYMESEMVPELQSSAIM